MYPRNLKDIVLSILGIIGFIFLVYWIKLAITYVPISQEMDVAEPYIMANVAVWANWDFYTINQMYTPVYFLVCAPLYKIFGWGLWEGRLVSVLATCGCLAFLFLILKQFTNNWKLSAVLSLLPLTHPIIRNWSLMTRVDMLAVCWELIGIYLFIRFSKDRISKKVLWSIPFFVLAFYTKQSVFVGAFAVAGWLLLKNWKFGLGYGVLLGGITALLWFWLVNFTIGHTWTEHLQAYQLGTAYFTVDPDRWKIIKLTGATYLPMAITVLMAGIYCWKRRMNWDFPFVYWLIAISCNIFFLIIIGGSYGRDVEFIFVTYFVAILFVYNLTLTLKIEKLVQIGVLAFVIQISVFLVLPAVVPLPDDKYVARCQEVTRIISDAEYPVLSQNGNLVMLADKENYGDPYGVTFTYSSGHIKKYSVLDDLSAKRISYVITAKELPNKDELQHYDAVVQKAILANYHLVYSEGMPKYPSWYSLVVYKASDDSVR